MIVDRCSRCYHSFFYRALEPGAAQCVNYIRLGAVLNSLYVVPLFLWLHRCRSARFASAVVVLVALNPWSVMNVYYTWPKMLAAACFLSALFILWDEVRPTAYHYGVTGGLFGLSILSHAGHAVSFPVFYICTLALHARSWPDVCRSLVLPLAIVLMQVPWLIYKQLYSPETFNLFTMHYLDGENLGGYGEPLMDNIRNFLAVNPLAVQVRVRLDQLASLWWTDIEFGEVVRFWSGSASGQLLFTREFFHPFHSAGLLWFALIPVALVVRIGRAMNGREMVVREWVQYALRSTRATGIPLELLMLLFAFASLSVNALLPLPSIDVHGMHFWAVSATIILLVFMLSSTLHEPDVSEP